jgi:hypothetical protein
MCVQKSLAMSNHSKDVEQHRAQDISLSSREKKNRRGKTERRSREVKQRGKAEMQKKAEMPKSQRAHQVPSEGRWAPIDVAARLPFRAASRRERISSSSLTLLQKVECS